MVDVMTLIVIIILVILMIIANIYILAYFTHPDETGDAISIVLKIFILLGLTLAWMHVLLLPLDVSNNRTFGGGLNMKVFWYIVYIATIVFILILFPISTSLYESDPESTCKENFFRSIWYFIAVLIFFVVVTLILYFTIGVAQIPIQTIHCNYNANVKSVANDSSFNSCTVENEKLEISVSFIVYCISVLSFVSWFIFAIFGGIGMASIPLDLFYSFKKRPKTLKKSEINERRDDLVIDLDELIKLGNEVIELENKGSNKKFFFRKERRNYERKKKQFKAGYALAKEKYKIVNAQEEAKKNEWVIVFYYLIIPLAIIASILSLIWLIQFCCSYFYRPNDRPVYPFLANFFIVLQDHNVAFLSFFFFALFNMYLLLCVISGNFKFGIRLFCCCAVHPMEKKKTYLNSFIFNVCLILLGSSAITQFCSDCLSDYVVFTDIDLLFNVQINYLKFFTIFYNNHIFQYIFLGVFVISLIYLLIKPNDDNKNINVKKDIIEKDAKDIKNTKKINEKDSSKKSTGNSNMITNSN